MIPKQFTLKQILGALAFITPILIGGINKYNHYESYDTRISAVEKWIEKEEDIRRQEELLKRFGDVNRLKSK